jgi:hypothetical protein
VSGAPAKYHSMNLQLPTSMLLLPILLPLWLRASQQVTPDLRAGRKGGSYSVPEQLPGAESFLQQAA